MNINIRGVWNSLSYGVVCKNILKTLDLLGYHVSFFPIGQIQQDSQDDTEFLTKILKNQDNFDSHAPSLSIWHQFDMGQHVGSGLRCGFPIFELDTLTDREKHHLNSLDMIFVASSWAKSVLINNGITADIHVAPLGVDTKIFNPIVSDTHTNTRFLVEGKLEVRKSHDLIKHFFNKAFTEYDNVELWMLVNNPFLTAEQHKLWVDFYKESALGDKITFLPPQPTQAGVAYIMNEVDCGLFLSRAEGFDLGALEMMACGKSIITTNYSAHTEFCTSKNSMFVDIDELEDAYDGTWFFGTGKWAHIGDKQIDQTVEYMKQVHKLKQSKHSIFNHEGIVTSKEFSWVNTVNKIAEGLDD